MKIRKEVKLAVTAIAAVIILIWGINFLKARALFDKNNIFYGIYDQVDGLKISSSVIYRGYHVGQVASIRFMGERYDKVLVQFSIGKNLEIPANSAAVIQNSDLMGSKSIHIIPGNSEMYAQSGDTLQARVELGLMEQVNQQLQPLKNKAENILSSMDSVLTALQAIFNKDTRGNIENSFKSINHTLQNVESASGNLDDLIAGQSSRISDILANINSITANLEGNNDNISKTLGNMALISDTLREANLGRSVRTLNSILAQLDSIVGKINRGKGTLGEAVNSDELYYNLTALSGNLNKLLSEFRTNPKRFINLSVFDFTSNKIKKDNYGIVIYNSETPLPLNHSLYLKYPDLTEFRHGGRFLYLVDTYKNIQQAEKELKTVNSSFEDAYIVKISQE